MTVGLLLLSALTVSFMLGSRTKKVYAYGKRNQRIVNITGGRQKVSSSIFDDLEPAPQWAPIASKMKKRENIVPPKSKSPSPKTIRINRKKRPSPVLSPAKKRTRVARIIQAEVPKHEPPVIKLKPAAQGAKNDIILIEKTPPRAPLALFSPNVPGSPAITGRPQGARVTLARGTPLRLKKPFSPFIDMDIIVMDDDGRTVRKERRVSRTDIESNPINQAVSKSHKQSKPRTQNVVATDSDSDVEVVGRSKSTKQLLRRAFTIYSDDSDSEDEGISSSSLPMQHEPSTKPQPVSRPLRAPGSSRTVVEVIIPPPSYPIRPIAKVRPPTEPAPLLPPPSISPHVFPTRYQQLSSPIAKPRQLTPIRGGRNRQLFAPPSPPSPFTGTDFDLSFEIEELTLASSSLHNKSHHLEPEIPQYLLPLLEECNQETQGPIDFSSFIETFPYDPVVQSDHTLLRDSAFRKIGEASYSEVFGIGNVVLKVIPLRDESIDNSPNPNSQPKMSVKYNGNGEEEDGPAPSDVKDVRKEIIVTRAMGDVCDGFVKLLRTYIVRGKYPEVLLQLWDKFNEERGSESVRPGLSILNLLTDNNLIALVSDTFLVSQVYAIIVLPNGGPDLEAYKFVNPSKMGWRQASSLFWQVARALAHAEQLVSFEVCPLQHRRLPV